MILAKLELEALRIKKENEYHAEQRRIIEHQERIEREEREQKKKEIKMFKKLIKQANRWHQAKLLRDYIQMLEEKMLKTGALTDENIKWLNWAKHKIDIYDPLNEKKET